MTPDIDHLRKWIGRSTEAAELVTAAVVQRFNATFDLQGLAVQGAVAPLMIHFCLAQPTAPTATLSEDGHPVKGGFLPPVPLPNRMWAGGAIDFRDDIRIGEVVRRNSIIRDVSLKQGRTGPLCFVSVDHAVFSGARPVLRERQDIVYLAKPAPPKAAAAAPVGASNRTVTPSAALLFRYSALTFNGHRIHYDKPYAQQAEGHAGLVVHGPLQATMLVQFAERLCGTRPARFSFRSMSPLSDTADFGLNAEADGDALRLWTASEGGPVAMEARAEW